MRLLLSSLILFLSNLAFCLGRITRIQINNMFLVWDTIDKQVLEFGEGRPEIGFWYGQPCWVISLNILVL